MSANFGIIILISSVLCPTSAGSASFDVDDKNGNKHTNDGNFQEIFSEKYYGIENYISDDIENATDRFAADRFLRQNYFPSIQDFNGTLSWKYEDQRAWSNLHPYCNGARQSPINIRSRYIVEGEAPCLVFRNYSSKHLNITVTNNGHTVEIDGPFGDGRSESQPTMSGGPLLGSYVLSGVHWHWGYDRTDGAEHAINSHKYPMEVHFVHYNTKYSSVADAIAAADPEGLAVIGILFEVSLYSTPKVRSMVNTVEKARVGQLSYPIHFPLDLVEYKTNYFTYVGSLTTPPCYEAVRWIVFETPLKIYFSRIDVFRAFRTNGEPLLDNFRAIQLLNGRKIIHNKAC